MDILFSPPNTVFVIVEPVANEERRSTHLGFGLVDKSKELSIYRPTAADIEVKEHGWWAQIGDSVATGYLHPKFNGNTAKAKLRAMLRSVDTIMGNVNCHEKGKAVAIEEIKGEEFELGDIGCEEWAREWGYHKCRIDEVLTNGSGKPLYRNNAWAPGSDHTMIGCWVTGAGQDVIKKVTDGKRWIHS